MLGLMRLKEAMLCVSAWRADGVAERLGEVLGDSPRELLSDVDGP